jgi:large subunit ribosomal protein L2
MSVRKLKPIPGQRFRVVNGYDAITTDKPERSLIAPIKTLVVEIVKER